jgi:RNA recognition motif-containing protein
VRNAKDISPQRESTLDAPARRFEGSRKIVDEPIVGDNRAFYVGNIPPITNERDIIAAFKQFGVPSSIVIPRFGSYSKGYAFVEFDDADVASKILNAELTLGGRRLILRWKRPRLR